MPDKKRRRGRRLRGLRDVGDNQLYISSALSVRTPLSAASGERVDFSEAVGQDEIITTPLDVLLTKRRPLQLASDLASTLGALRTRLGELQRTAVDPAAPAADQAKSRRAQEAYEHLKVEVENTKKTIRRMMVISKVMDRVVELRTAVFDETRISLEKEAEELRARVGANAKLIRNDYVNRVNLLHRYWLWRTLQELGDVKVGRTFSEELARGPRYRSIGLQNCILSDTLEQQLAWLRSFAAREEFFRNHVRRLDSLVEELTDINEALEESLVCRVCGLLFENPVILWPCGHSFCLVCFDSLSIAPSLFRCPTCGSIGSEGYLHNILLAESLAKWVFKEAGYGDIHGAIGLVRLHLSKFRKEVFAERIADISARLDLERSREMQEVEESDMNISYRMF